MSGTPGDTTARRAGAVSASNRFGVDYRDEAARLGAPPVPIIDAHCHINGTRAARVFGEVCALYGIERVYTQTQLAQADGVRAVLGDRVRFVAIPEYMHEDRRWAFTEGFVENLGHWHERGARMVKFWGAPRLRDFVTDLGMDAEDIVPFDAPWRLRVADRARELGMALMVHVADPDTWFRTKYADASFYGTKREQYASLERLLDRTGAACLGAHMAGSPEDLSFLSDLLERHERLVIDTSATKWMVRELSGHGPGVLRAFLDRYEGRVLFGSDIVTHDAHLEPSDPDDPGFGNQLASSEREAFDLYASRYWALRTLFETRYEGESNIADPDLAMLDPSRFDAMSAPTLRGVGLEEDRLKVLYRDACVRTLDAWYEDS